MQIKKTTDYELFKYIVGNRSIDEGHVKRLEKSILQKNMLHLNPIKVNAKFGVLDGQHRLEVAKKNNLAIYYIKITEFTSLEDIIRLQTQAEWQLKNYLESWILRGIEDYSILENFCNTYDLPITVSVNLLLGNHPVTTHGHSKSVVQIFKEGQFRVKNLKKAMDLADKLVLVKPYVDGQIWRDRSFLSALQKAFSKVGSMRFLKKLETTGIKVRKQMGVKEYLRVLEDIYNHRLREGNKIRFF